MIVHVHTDLWIARAHRVDLSLTAPVMTGDMARQLDVYLRDNVSASLINAVLVLQMPQMVILAFVGVYRSTVVATALLPALLIGGLWISPEVPFHSLGLRGLTLIVFTIVLAALMVAVTKTRRHSFSVEQALQASLEQVIDTPAAPEAATEAATEKADSVLYHSLKNTMADSAGEIELFLQTTGHDAATCAPLRQAVACLHRGMRSCRHRQAYLRLVAGNYVPMLRAVRTSEFARDLTAGRLVALQVADLCVYIDPLLCSLVLDNAVSNAFKHGRPRAPDVRLFCDCVERPGDEAGTAGGAGRRARLRFRVTNAVNPKRPRVTDLFVKQVLSGKAQPQSALSDHIGLSHSFLAADAQGMEVSLVQEADCVLFEAVVDVEVTTEDMVEAETEGRGEFPDDLVIHFLDDSESARRLMQHQLSTWANITNVRTFGADAADVPEFVRYWQPSPRLHRQRGRS